MAFVDIQNLKCDAVYLVSVTYGERGGMLEQLIRRCFEEKWLTKVVLVSNASRSPLRDLLRNWLADVIIIDNPRNLGSAAAYSQGIAAALADGADYVLLMDDDNAPAPGSVPKLLSELKALASTIGFSHTAVAGFRPAHQPDIAQGKPPPLPSSFLGFHISQIPYKVRSRLGRRKKPQVGVGAFADLPFAAYGGLLAHRTLFESIGLPKNDLILYEDDTEYTRRIFVAGGVIRLFTNCLIEDLEQSWNTNSPQTAAAARIVKLGANFRVFYSLRNRTWFDHYCYSTNQSIYYINMFTYLLMISWQTLRARRFSRLKLILRAVFDGERARLGMHPEFPLL